MGGSDGYDESGGAAGASEYLTRLTTSKKATSDYPKRLCAEEDAWAAISAVHGTRGSHSVDITYVPASVDITYVPTHSLTRFTHLGQCKLHITFAPAC